MSLYSVSIPLVVNGDKLGFVKILGLLTALSFSFNLFCFIDQKDNCCLLRWFLKF